MIPFCGGWKPDSCFSFLSAKFQLMATIGWLAPTYDGANTLSAWINVDARLPKNVNEVIANQETFFCLTKTE